MSERKPLIRLSYSTKDKRTFSVLSIWKGGFPGAYTISRDKGSDRFPAMTFGEAVKAWTLGEGFLNVIVESETVPRDGAPRQETKREDEDLGF